MPTTVRGKLIERQNELAAQLVKGGAEDWPDYKHRVGVINGIQEAIAICVAIEREQER